MRLTNTAIYTVETFTRDPARFTFGLPMNSYQCFSRSLIVLLIVTSLQSVTAQSEAMATLSGRVDFPSPKEVIKRGAGYTNADGSHPVHSDDPLARMDRNIIVSLQPLDFEVEVAPTPDAVITQKQQTFLPHVLPITRGSTVYFLNEDEYFHSIYSLKPGSRFNIGRRPPGSPYALPIKKRGIIKLNCDIHPHMEAFILSLETPYFTRVDANGNYRIDDLPPGRYRLDLYYPGEKRQSQEIDLAAGATLSLDLPQ